MLAFILLASRLGRPVAAADAAKCTRYDMAELAFEPDQYLGWHSKDRRLFLYAWQAFSEQGQIGSHWHVDRDNVVLFSGLPIPLDAPWTPGIGWAEQLAERIAASDAPTVAAELGGAFDLLHLRPDGTSIVINDLLGGAPIYSDASQELLVISNRANLVASVWEQPGANSVRDWRGPAWPVFAGKVFGSDTGLKDVAAHAPGEWWELGWKKRPVLHSRTLPASPLQTKADAIDQIESSLRRSLRACASLPFQRVSLELDGGAASRLLLGVAAAEGLLDRVALTTTGEPDEPGVQIAAELADRVGRPLLLESRLIEDPGEFEQQARIHSFQTSGVGSLWDLAGRLASVDHLRIESATAGFLAPRSTDSSIEAAGGVSVRRDEQSAPFDPQSILRQPIVSFYANRLASQYAREVDTLAGPISVAAGIRAIAAAVETSPVACAWPFLDPAIWSALASLDDVELASRTIATTILRRIAPELVDIPVCDDLTKHDGRVAGFPSLLPVFEDYLLDPTNPMQDLVDSEGVAALLADPNRPVESVRTLYDLLSVAIWLGQDEQELRIHRADEMDLRGVFSPLDYREPVLLGDESLLPAPDVSVRHRATDQLLDNLIKLDKVGHHLRPDARILGVIPYYEAEEYLEAAIDSLVRQSRPLHGIVVIDDCSSTPPTRTLEKFPGVTLLRSDENSGPYRMIQEVISNTGYDAYLFQDADDWAADNRLEILLDLATRTGKELIGSQGHRLIVDEGEVVLYQHPLNPELTFQNTPKSKPVHHPTSLVTRDLIMRSGGFANALPYSGDTEFLRRAATIGPIANTAEFIYVYRTRSDSLTGSEETGVHTAVRRELWAIQHPRAQWIAERANAGLGPVLAPMAVTSPPTLTHLSGPALLGIDGRAWPHEVEAGIGLEPPAKRSASRRRTTPQPPHPVFVIGPPRSGASILALAIAQLPSFKLSLDPTWLTNLSTALHLAFTSVEESDTINDLEIRRVDTEQFAAHFGVAAHDLILRGIDPNVAAPLDDEYLSQMRTAVKPTQTRIVAEGEKLAQHGFDLYRLFPHAKFIHVLRDPDEVVAAHQKDKRMLYRSRFVYMDEERAYDRWIESVQAARDLEIALGAERVMRVDRAALLSEPEPILRQVLRFIDEPYDPVVLRPFV
ncbi:MAG: sulfotransferase [Thermomicrobiales bacterium]